MLPSQSVRVMSLVPADASDIRDTSAETFGDIDQRAFRANLFTVIGGVLFVVAALLGLLALVRLFRRYRTPAIAAERPITDGAILRGVGRELAAVRARAPERRLDTELAGRALAPLRVAATDTPSAAAWATSISVRSPQPAITRSANPRFEDPGRLALTVGWFKGSDRRLRARSRRAASRRSRRAARECEARGHARLARAGAQPP